MKIDNENYPYCFHAQSLRISISLEPQKNLERGSHQCLNKIVKMMNFMLYELYLSYKRLIDLYFLLLEWAHFGVPK